MDRSAIVCSCGAVIVDDPGYRLGWHPHISPRSCWDCDPDGYEERWSCPFPPETADGAARHWRTRAERLAERVAALEAAVKRALDGCSLCRAGICRAPAHVWLSDALADGVKRS